MFGGRGVGVVLAGLDVLGVDVSMVAMSDQEMLINQTGVWNFVRYKYNT